MPSGPCDPHPKLERPPPPPPSQSEIRYYDGDLKGIRLLETTLYARDQGPQCFEAEILFQHESAEAFVEQLRKCRLTWYWHSVREEGQPVVPGQPELPRYRPLTLLTDQNWHDLVLDIDEKVGISHEGNRTLASVGIDFAPYSEHRNLMLFGLDTELAAPLEATLDEAAQRFLQDLGPLQIVIDRIQDEPYEFLYFRHQISPEVRCLLDAWRLDPKHAAKVRPYKKLAEPLRLEFFLPDMNRWFR